MALDLQHTARVDSKRVYTPQVEVNCSKITVPSDGKVKAMTIPAGFNVQEVYTEVLTAEGSALDIDVGDSGTVNQFGDALDGNASTTNLDTSGGSSTPYTSDDYLQLMFKADGTDNATQPSTVKVRVTCVMFDLGAQ